MLDETLVFAISRSIERLLIDLIFGLSLVMGWNLFRVGMVEAQSAILSGKGISLRLQRVGPGIFFALFGSIGLAIAVQRPVDLKHDVGGHIGPSTHTDSSYAASDTGMKDVITAITTIQMFGLPKEKPINDAEKAAIDRALSVLTQEREILLRASFPDSYDTFVQLSKDPTALTRLSPEARKRLDKDQFAEFQAASNHTFVTDAKDGR